MELPWFAARDQGRVADEVVVAGAGPLQRERGPRIAGGAVPNNGPDDLKRWIMNPPALKPGTIMPNTGLTDAEATTVVAFLETLK